MLGDQKGELKKKQKIGEQNRVQNFISVVRN